MEMLKAFFENIDWLEIWLATGDTLLMLGGSLLFTVLLGLPLGVLLFLCSPRQLLENRGFYAFMSLAVNILRSLPFIILLIVMIPFTVLITGTSLGVAGAIPPLVVGATRSSRVWWKPRCVKSIAASSKPLNRWVRPPGRSS